MKKIILFFIFISAFLSCKKDKTESPEDFGYSYFPLSLHQTWLYSADSIIYNNFTQQRDSIHFFLKDSIVKIDTGDAGKISYKLNRYKRSTDSADWRYESSMSIFLSQNNIIITENNNSFVKLVFPVLKDKQWNGNAYNGDEEQDYFYKEVDVPQTTNNKTFPHSLLIIQQDEENRIEEKFSSEIYSKNIGLIAKEVRNLEKDFSTGVITKGFIYTQKIQ